MAVDWSHRSAYIVRKHGVTADQADEALADDNKVIFTPAYNSKSGTSDRTIGDSPSYGDILIVITVDEDGVTYGVNAWKSNERDRRYYEQGGTDE